MALFLLSLFFFNSATCLSKSFTSLLSFRFLTNKSLASFPVSWKWREKVNQLGKHSCRIFQISEQLWPFQTKNSKEQNKAGNFWQKRIHLLWQPGHLTMWTLMPEFWLPYPLAWSLTPLISNAPIFKFVNLMPYPCSHFYFDIKFGDRLYSKENRPGSPLLFWI